MALNSATKTTLSLLLVLAVSFSRPALASDPDILTDFIAPVNTSIDGTFFTFTGLRKVLETVPQELKVTKASMAEFPALNGSSVSFAILQFPAAGVNPPHTHPRSAELLFVVQGSLEVGFVDTKNVLYTQRLRGGDMFIFPKGLIHFQFNHNHQLPAIAISAFGSASAGLVSMPTTVFSTDIVDAILAESFKTDVPTIEHIKAGLTKP